MCTRGLPDIYTLSPRACGPRASGVYIRQTTRAHGITTKYMYIYVHNVFVHMNIFNFTILTMIYNTYRLPFSYNYAKQ